MKKMKAICNKIKREIILLILIFGLFLSGFHYWLLKPEWDSVVIALDTTLCDKVYQWLATGRRFTPVSSTNKTDRHDIAKILLKVALNTINHNSNPPSCLFALLLSKICCMLLWYCTSILNVYYYKMSYIVYLM